MAHGAVPLGVFSRLTARRRPRCWRSGQTSWLGEMGAPDREAHIWCEKRSPENHFRTREPLHARWRVNRGRRVYERGAEPAGVWERDGAARTTAIGGNTHRASSSGKAAAAAGLTGERGRGRGGRGPRAALPGGGRTDAPSPRAGRPPGARPGRRRGGARAGGGPVGGARWATGSARGGGRTRWGTGREVQSAASGGEGRPPVGGGTLGCGRKHSPVGRGSPGGGGEGSGVRGPASRPAIPGARCSPCVCWRGIWGLSWAAGVAGWGDGVPDPVDIYIPTPPPRCSPRLPPTTRVDGQDIYPDAPRRITACTASSLSIYLARGPGVGLGGSLNRTFNWSGAPGGYA